MQFDDTETKRQKFYQHKSPILISNIDVNKIVVSNKFPFSKQDFKYFSRYKDANKNKTFMHIPSKNKGIYKGCKCISKCMCMFKCM